VPTSFDVNIILTVLVAKQLTQRVSGAQPVRQHTFLSVRHTGRTATLVKKGVMTLQNLK
jgi:hypothetical protein